MKKILFFVLSFITLSLSMVAYGKNETTTNAGGISLNNPAITIVRQELTIAPNQVDASYLVENNSKEDIATPISFMIPNTNVSTSETDSNASAPTPNYTVSVQGQPVTLTATNDSNKTLLQWTQTFPAQQLVLIEARYVPASNDVISPATIDWNKFIGGKSIKDQTNYTNLSNISYLLMGMLNPKNPIKNFTLTIKNPDTGLVAYNHFYDKQKVISENINNGIRIFIQNFSPKQNLQVVYALPNNGEAITSTAN